MSGRRIAHQNGLARWLKVFSHPSTGPLPSLLDGCLCLTANDHGYIARGSVPPYSVAYWVAPTDLESHPSRPNRFLLPWHDRCVTVKYVGDASAPTRIISGTLLRLSLSQWLQPIPAGPDGCWLQISGVYLPSWPSLPLPAKGRREDPRLIDLRPAFGPNHGVSTETTHPPKDRYAVPKPSRSGPKPGFNPAVNRLASTGPSTTDAHLDGRALIARISANDNKLRGRRRSAPVPKRLVSSAAPAARKGWRLRPVATRPRPGPVGHPQTPQQDHAKQSIAVASVRQVAQYAEGRKANPWTALPVSKLPVLPDWRDQD
jgi:hypothetical protein